MIDSELCGTYKNTWFVLSIWVEINSYWNWLFHDGCGQIVAVIHICVSRHLKISPINLTLLINPCVRIFWLLDYSLLFYISICIVHKTTMTSVISIRIWTIEQLLSRKLLQCSSRYFTQCLYCPNCSKSPAGSALTFILYTCDITFLNPVDLVCCWR